MGWKDLSVLKGNDVLRMCINTGREWCKALCMYGLGTASIVSIRFHMEVDIVD